MIFKFIIRVLPLYSFYYFFSNVDNPDSFWVLKFMGLIFLTFILCFAAADSGYDSGWDDHESNK